MKEDLEKEGVIFVGPRRAGQIPRFSALFW